MRLFQNYIIEKAPFNMSDTFIDISAFNRVITRNKLVFDGCSLFDIQFLYPLFSDLTYSTSTIVKAYSKTSSTN